MSELPVKPEESYASKSVIQMAADDDKSGYTLAYEFTLLKKDSNQNITKSDAGGTVNLSVSKTSFFLFLYNVDSPEIKFNNTKYKGQFPGMGGLEIAESNTDDFVAILNKFLDWDSLSNQQKLVNITKNLGSFGPYKVSYYRSEFGEGYCGIIMEPSEDISLDRALHSNITIFPSCAKQILKLIPMRFKKRAEEAAAKTDAGTMQQKADAILK